MDLAPALPPSQDTLPAFVSSADYLPQETDLDVVSLPAKSVQLSSVRPFLPNLPSGLIHSIAGIEAIGEKALSLSTGFVSVSGLSHSFNFVGQAFRTARIGSITGQTLYSSTLPVQWVSEDSWQGQTLAADIKVKRVDVIAGTAQLENNVWSADFIEQCMPGADRQLQDGVRYKISIGDRTLGYVADENRAYLLSQQLKRLIGQASFKPDAIALYPLSEDNTLRNASAIVGTPDQPMFAINDAMSTAVGYSPDWAAVSWANNLRLALGAAPLQPGDALMGLKGLEDSQIDMAGEASWYGPYFHGRATANGETYDQYDLTVAHKSLPFGTQLKVRNVVNDKTVVVRVNDRGPYVGDRILDLSRAAADCLGSDQAGVIPVEAVVLKDK
ncbi:MAG: septal ring lytic transglycosylase RlpA family protein [Phormidesmis sp.]